MNVNNNIQHIPRWWYWYLVLPLIAAIVLLAIWLCVCHFLPTLFTGHICSISSAQVYLEEEGQLKLDTFYAQMSTFYSTIIIVLLAMVTLIQIAATMYYSKKTSLEAEKMLSDYTANGSYKNQVMAIWDKEIPSLLEKRLNERATKDIVENILRKGNYFSMLYANIQNIEEDVQKIKEDLIQNQNSITRVLDNKIERISKREWMSEKEENNQSLDN